MLDARQKRLLDEGASPTRPEQLMYVLDRTVRRYIKLTASDQGSHRDVEAYAAAIGVLESVRSMITRDYLTDLDVDGFPRDEK